MPMPIHMSLQGAKQGKIEGSVTIQGREGTILVQMYDHTIDIPKSPQTGLPTGKRVHGPLKITKEIDKSSPKLMQALAKGERMDNVTLDFYRINAQGKEEKYYTVKLENAIIVSRCFWFPNALDKTQGHIPHMEDVAFSYEKITETWQPDGIETEDSWLIPG